MKKRSISGKAKNKIGELSSSYNIGNNIEN
jgi:hypothetical protein